MRIALACLLAVGVVGCGPAPASNFKDAITVGTGMNGFALIGENTTFSLAMTRGSLAIKVESSADFDGRAVRVYTNGGTYGQKDYPVLQPTGHLLVTTDYRITDVGTFTLKAVLVREVGGGIGEETEVATTTVTMTN